jgi:hypothetical protein
MVFSTPALLIHDRGTFMYLNDDDDDDDDDDDVYLNKLHTNGVKKSILYM